MRVLNVYMAIRNKFPKPIVFDIMARAWPYVILEQAGKHCNTFIMDFIAKKVVLNGVTTLRRIVQKIPHSASCFLMDILDEKILNRILQASDTADVAMVNGNARAFKFITIKSTDAFNRMLVENKNDELLLSMMNLNYDIKFSTIDALFKAGRYRLILALDAHIFIVNFIKTSKDLAGLIEAGYDVFADYNDLLTRAIKRGNADLADYLMFLRLKKN